jgi:hypothetical protein
MDLAARMVLHAGLPCSGIIKPSPRFPSSSLAATASAAFPRRPRSAIVRRNVPAVVSFAKKRKGYRDEPTDEEAVDELVNEMEDEVEEEDFAEDDDDGNDFVSSVDVYLCCYDWKLWALSVMQRDPLMNGTLAPFIESLGLVFCL